MSNDCKAEKFITQLVLYLLRKHQFISTKKKRRINTLQGIYWKEIVVENQYYTENVGIDKDLYEEESTGGKFLRWKEYIEIIDY